MSSQSGVSYQARRTQKLRAGRGSESHRGKRVLLSAVWLSVTVGSELPVEEVQEASSPVFIRSAHLSGTDPRLNPLLLLSSFWAHSHFV